MFIETTKAKAEAHGKVAQYWNSVNTYLGLILILLSAVTTVLAAIEVEGVSKMVTVGLSGLTTLISAVAGENSNVQCQVISENDQKIAEKNQKSRPSERRFDCHFAQNHEKCLGFEFLGHCVVFRT